MRTCEKINLTPHAVDLGACQDGDGRDLVVAVLKATWTFTSTGRLSPAAKDLRVPVFLADVHHGDPAETSVQWASDVVPRKRGTDVAVNGHAYGRGRKKIEAGFTIGNVQKLIEVSGPRVWVAGHPPGIAGPVAFDKVPLRFEHAYGGAYDDPQHGRVPYPMNPVGVGFAPALSDRAPLPSLEYRDGHFRQLKDRPAPASLGFVPAGWKQRARFAGTFDERWASTRRPLLPEDLDERFYNAVPEDQVLEPKLAGGERLVLRGVHPEAEVVTLEMPRSRFIASFHVRDRVVPVPMVADTLLAEPDEARLAISFRSALPLDDDLRDVRSVTFRADGGGAAR
jgi:hypothetical protein